MKLGRLSGVLFIVSVLVTVAAGPVEAVAAGGGPAGHGFGSRAGEARQVRHAHPAKRPVRFRPGRPSTRVAALPREVDADNPGGTDVYEHFPWLPLINPHYGDPDAGRRGYATNCQYCTLAVERKLATGVLYEAQPLETAHEDLGFPRKLEMAVGSGERLRQVRSRNEIRWALRRPGARGIVFVEPVAGTPGHVFNAVNVAGTLYYLDGQSGELACFPSGGRLFLLIADGGRGQTRKN
jgi:hypothetical protein